MDQTLLTTVTGLINTQLKLNRLSNSVARAVYTFDTIYVFTWENLKSTESSDVIQFLNIDKFSFRYFISND